MSELVTINSLKLDRNRLRTMELEVFRVLAAGVEKYPVKVYCLCRVVVQYIDSTNTKKIKMFVF